MGHISFSRPSWLSGQKSSLAEGTGALRGCGSSAAAQASTAGHPGRDGGDLPPAQSQATPHTCVHAGTCPLPVCKTLFFFNFLVGLANHSCSFPRAWQPRLHAFPFTYSGAFNFLLTTCFTNKPPEILQMAGTGAGCGTRWGCGAQLKPRFAEAALRWRSSPALLAACFCFNSVALHSPGPSQGA